MPSRKTSPMGTKKAFSQAQIIESVTKMTGLEDQIAAALKRRFKVKADLTDGQKAVATMMAKSIVVNETEEQWIESIASYLKEPKNIAPEVAAALDTISLEHDVDSWTAIVLWRSQIDEQDA